jgi:hypothetical protein
VYAVATLFGPVDPTALQKYNLTTTQTHLLLLTVVIPFVAICFTAYLGFSRIKRYATVIAGTEEGPAFRYISNGLGLLAFSLPVNSALSAVATWISISHPSYTNLLTITRNYLAIILPLLAFICVSRGAEKLTNLLKESLRRPLSIHYWLFGAVCTSSIFSWLMIARPADDRLAMNIYQLPNWAIILTLTIPYLYTWFRGFVSVFYIAAYQRNVKGKLYRSSLRSLSMGILTVIIANILIQCIATLSSRLYRLHVTPVLLIIYLLITLYAPGTAEWFPTHFCRLAYPQAVSKPAKGSTLDSPP